MKRLFNMLFVISLVFSMLYMMPVRAEESENDEQPQTEVTEDKGKDPAENVNSESSAAEEPSNEQDSANECVEIKEEDDNSSDLMLRTMSNSASQVPEVLSIEMDRTTISPEQGINFIVRINDNGHIINNLWLYCVSDETIFGTNFELFQGGVDPDEYRGTSYSDIYSHGIYRIGAVKIYYDENESYSYFKEEYYEDDSQFIPGETLPYDLSNLYYTVENPNPDTSAPTITPPIVLSKNVMDGTSDIILFDADVQDDISGLMGGELEFTDEKGHIATAYVNNTGNGRIMFGEYSTIYDGVYHLTGIRLLDHAGNELKYRKDVTDPKKQLPLPAEFETVGFEAINCTSRGRWESDSYGTKYVFDDGESPYNTIFEVDGTEYVFDYSGYLFNGWFDCDDGSRVYVENGIIAKSKWINGVYYVDENGHLARSEWVDDGKYYVDRDGRWIENAIKGEVNEIYSVSGNKNEATLTIGDTYRFQIIALPEEAAQTGKGITWTSANTEVATVSSDGLVTATGLGHTNIYASLANGQSCTYYVSCVAKADSIEFINNVDFRISDEYCNSNSVYHERSASQFVRVLPKEAQGTKIIITSSDPSVIGVQKDRIIILKAGKSTVTFTVENDPNHSISHEFEVFESVNPQTVEITNIPDQLYVGYTYPSLTAVYGPDDAKINTVWTSSDPDIISAPDPDRSEGNRFYLSSLKKPGHVTITAQSKYNADVTASVTLNVVEGSPEDGTYDAVFVLGETDLQNWGPGAFKGKETTAAEVEVGKSYVILVYASSYKCVPDFQCYQKINRDFYAANPGLKEEVFKGGMAGGTADPKEVTFGWPLCFTVTAPGTYIYSAGGNSIKLTAKGQPGWKSSSNGWWYDNGDGTYPKNEIKTIKGTDYYFNASGYMVTGWAQINGKWYVFDSSGAMKKNTWEGNYYLKEDGTMAVSEWVCNNQYYVGADGLWIPDYGVAKWKQDSTGWWYDSGDGTYPHGEFKTISGTEYYFKENGYMATGWTQIDGKWYVFDSSGAMKKNTWEGNYYLKEDGTMAVSEWVCNNQYYVGADGKWIPDYGVAKWKQDSTGWWYDNGDGTYPHGEFKTIEGADYYFKENGYMATGWTQINGKWYVFTSSGAMKKNAWEGNYWLGEEGVMATDAWVDNDRYYVGPDGAWVPNAKKQ